MSRPITLFLTMIPLAIASGCSSADERLVEVSRQSIARQAEQNQEIARQSQEVVKSTHDLVQADAQARTELIAAQRSLQEGLQSERRRLDQQRQELAQDRRELAETQQREPIIADAIKGTATLVACLLPLVLAIYLIRSLGNREPDQAVAELLIQDLISDRPLILPGVRSSPERHGHAPELPSLPPRDEQRP